MRHALNSETRETTYTDFGRFGFDQGYGITRIDKSNLKTINAEFDNSGNLANADAIVKSLTSPGNYFGTGTYGGEISYATINNVDYTAMKNFAEGYGTKIFGLLEGGSYCAKYAYDLIVAGGAKVRHWDIAALTRMANQLIEQNQWLSVISFMGKLPSPINIVNNLKGRYKKMKSDTFKF